MIATIVIINKYKLYQAIQQIGTIKTDMQSNTQNQPIQNKYLDSSNPNDQADTSHNQSNNRYHNEFQDDTNEGLPVGINSSQSKKPIDQQQKDDKDGLSKKLSNPELTKNRYKKSHKKTLTNMTEMGNKEDLKTENKKLKLFNSSLKKQLESFERKLDESLKKRIIGEKKPRVSQQIVQNMELQNAYKQIQIYKRDILNMKKKETYYTENKVDEMANSLKEFQREREELIKQIKLLQKQNKLQNKKIKELAGPDLSKIIEENENLKQQNKRLLNSKAKEQRTDQLSRIMVSNQKKRAKTMEKQIETQKKKEEEKEQIQLDILKKKAAKDNIKIGGLMSENNKLRELNENLREQLLEKDKECRSLKERLANLRKQYRHKTMINESSIAKSQIKNQQNSGSHQEKANSTDLKQTDREEKEKNSLNGGLKYPKLVEGGKKMEESYKWNHHQYSSKIKEVQVLPNPDQTIKQLNFRYEKGEPNRISNQEKFLIFSCQGDQYIKSIKGTFKDSCLHFLSMKTSKERVHTFGNSGDGKGDDFVFAEGENEYPGAFFGENSNNHVNRVGCLVELMK